MSQSILAPGAVAGDRLDDEDQDVKSRLRVLEVRDECADEVEIEDGTTVADVNPDEFADDTIVEVVFESDLDRRAPNWREWPVDELPERLEEFRAEWGVDVRTYDFPRGRLEVFGR